MLSGDERADWSMLKPREYSCLSLAFQKMSLRLVFQVGALKASLAYLREGARRAWEVENLVGEVVRIAVEKGVPVPVLGAVYGMARSVMWGLREEWGMLKVEDEREKLKKAQGVQ